MAGKRGRQRTAGQQQLQQQSPPHQQQHDTISNLTSRPTGSAVGGQPAGEPRGGGGGGDLSALTKQQLQAECRRRGQKTTGTKVELLQRLGHKMSSKRNVQSTTNASSNGNASGEHPVKVETKEAKKTNAAAKQKEKEDRESLVLWKRPLKTLEYSAKEVLVLLYTYGKSLLSNKQLVVMSILVILSTVGVTKLAGPHQTVLGQVYAKFFWCTYWIGLGILSSVGLGTGLHTFVLYLGPHITKVTLAAYECGTLDFPEPPYPDDIICPTGVTPQEISIFAIMSKVRLEAMCWGAGTALGELPPYFMARAARLSGYDPDDDENDLAEFEELQKKKKEELTLVERGKLYMESIVRNVGFIGILACASIPNPLFDLAGITCGHFLVPFWTFFGATLIGKAVIKMHIQKVFVIMAFNETLINTALSWLTAIPIVGPKIEAPFRGFLDGQKKRLHAGSAGGDGPEGGNLLGAIFEKFVFAMILYFIISIVNSFAQSYHKRLSKKKGSKTYKD